MRRALLAIGALLLSGCRFEGVPVPPPWQAAASERLPFRVAVAPVRVDASAIAARHANVAGRHGSAPDAEGLRREVIEALRAERAFERVQARGTPASTPEGVREAAWDEGDDLILELEVLDHHQEYLGHSNYVGWFVVYASFVWPAWWVPVDYYGGGLTVRARLRSVQERAAPLLERTYEVAPRETQQELTPSDRELAGFLDWGALWNVESSLEASNWRAIERAVAPHARRRFLEALLRDVRREVATPLLAGAPAEREEVLRRVRKRLAVVVGVSAYADETLGGGAHASEDARALGALFARPEAGGLIEGRDLTCLVDEQATRSAVLDAIAAVGFRAATTDEVVIYVAGLGAALPASDDAATDAALAALGGAAALGGGAPRSAPAVLLHDTRADDLGRTALLLSDLGRALRQIRAERVLVVLDTSFGASSGASRTLSLSGAEVRAVDLARALDLAPGHAAVLAARPDQPARVLPGAQTGLFGEVLRAAIGGAADRDADGRVTAVEAFEHARAAVAGRAALEGFEQEPMALGLGDVAGGLAWPR